MHIEYLAIGKQRVGSRIIFGQVTAKHQWALKDGPKVHHRILLISCKLSPAFCAALSTDTDLSQGKHVRIGPRARSDVGSPLGTHLELIVQLAPVIPEIIHRAPHISMFLHVTNLIERSLAWRYAQHNRSTTLIDSLTYQLYFSRVVRTRQVVNLHEIDTPLGVQIETRVVILLCAGLGAIYLIIVAQPGTRRIIVTDHIACDTIRTLHRQHLLCSHLGQATHEMYAKLQSLVVHIVGQCLESHAIGCRGEAIECWGISTILIIYVDRVCLVISARLVVLHKPAYIHHHIFPAIGSQVLGHVVGILFYLCFHYRGTKAVP